MATEVTALAPNPTPVSAYKAVELGQLGSDYLDNTTDYTNVKEWCAITVIAEATFTKLVSTTMFVNGAAAPGTVTKTIGIGTTIYGRFSEIQLASGAVVAYRAK